MFWSLDIVLVIVWECIPKGQNPGHSEVNGRFIIDTSNTMTWPYTCTKNNWNCLWWNVLGKGVCLNKRCFFWLTAGDRLYSTNYRNSTKLALMKNSTLREALSLFKIYCFTDWQSEVQIAAHLSVFQQPLWLCSPYSPVPGVNCPSSSTSWMDQVTL